MNDTVSNAETATPTLECFPTRVDPPTIVPGRPERDWMDAFASRHPYRCLPLTMANTTGWEVLCPFGFEARWDGRKGAESITFKPDKDAVLFDHFATSHFTEGVLTFHVGWLFRTPPGWALRAAGAPNRPKHGIAPLEGLIETDWLPYPFTMNWRFTAPGRVRFEKDEPFCFLQPIEHHRIETFKPVRAAFGEDADLAKQYAAWTEARTMFNNSLAASDPEAMKQMWQRYYFRGEYPDPGAERPEGHVSKRRLVALPDVPPPPPDSSARFSSWSAARPATTTKKPG